MGILDAALGQLASTLIGTFSDVPATYTRAPAPSYDVRTGSELAFPSVSYQIKITPPTLYSKREVNGTTVLATDLRAYVAKSDLPLDPAPRSDSLTWRGSTYQVVSANPVGTADSDVLVELQLRA